MNRHNNKAHYTFTRVLVMFKIWIEQHYTDWEENSELSHLYNDFVKTCIDPYNTAIPTDSFSSPLLEAADQAVKALNTKVAHTLNFIIATKLIVFSQMRAPVLESVKNVSKIVPQAIVFDFLSWDVKDIAKQLTLLENNLFVVSTYAHYNRPHLAC